MPSLALSPGVELFYRIDDYTDPWTEPQTVLCLHGLAESGEAWRGWVPHLARRWRVVRPDLRGFGASTPMPAGFDWSVDVPVEDVARLARELGLTRFHLVSCKFGGTVAMRFAARYPELVETLSVVSAPVSLQESLGSQIPGWARLLETGGVRGWAAETMANRLGSAVPAEAARWWTDLMGRTADSTVAGIFRTLAQVDIRDDLPRIQCPTLIVTTTGSGLGPVDYMRSWQRRIPDSRLEVIDSDSYHVAAAMPDHCARAVAAFIAGQEDAQAAPAHSPERSV